METEYAPHSHRGHGFAVWRACSRGHAPISDAQAQSEKKFEKPVLVTSSGQALDAFTVKTLLGRAGVERELRSEGHGGCT